MKELLKEYADAVKLIDETEAEINYLLEHRVAFDSVKGSNPNYPYEPRVFHIEGLEYKWKDKEVHELEILLRERRDKAKDIRLKVESWMNTIPIRMQRIVRMRYFQGCSWEQISARLGFMSSDAARMELTRYFKKYEK